MPRRLPPVQLVPACTDNVIGIILLLDRLLEVTVTEAADVPLDQKQL